ncbi:putative CALMODULIN-BINDING PROTEIN60 [Helianthus annuus]|nr:putative CALMODULIN-BINDING PROTEIN60 [Helianthus annuus]
MASNPQRSDVRSTDDYGSELNTSSTVELAAISELTRGAAGELTVIRTLQRLIGPVFVPLFRPLICQLVSDELAKQKALISMKGDPENKGSTSVLKRLKLQFRNKIALPVYTGMPLLSDNDTPIEIALIDLLNDQIVNTGAESTAKLEIFGFRVGDDGGNDDDSWTYSEFQEKILSERKGKRILQGKTSLQLKEGVGFVDKKISITHNSEHTRNGLYRLVATVVDAALMNRVEVAWTETFVVKDYRNTYHEKYLCPALSDKVYRLQQISYNGARYKRLKKEHVCTVKDLLGLLYTDSKRLEDILKLKASSNSWDEIVNNAQASNGLFLYLDPRNEQKSGVVLDVKLQLKALIVEPRRYIAANQLSERQKVEIQDLVKFASEHFDLLQPFDHETSLEEHLQSGTALPPVGITDGPPRPSSHVINTSHILNNSNGKPFVTTQSERGKEKVPFDDETIPSTNDYQEHVSFHPSNLNSPSVLNSGAATEPGTSSQAVESIFDAIFDISSPILGSQFDSILNEMCDILNESSNECQCNPAIVSLCNIARERWTKVSKLLRRNSVRERISLSQGIQPLKKQRCC